MASALSSQLLFALADGLLDCQPALLWLLPAAAVSVAALLCSPLSYGVSLSALESAYKRLQKSLHPDRFHGDKQVGQDDRSERKWRGISRLGQHGLAWPIRR